MLTIVPPLIWAIQREAKPGQPLETKNAQDRVPWLGLTTCPLLELGLSNPEFGAPHSMFLSSLIKLIFNETYYVASTV